MFLTLLQAFESALRVAINVLSKSKIIVEKLALLRSNVLSTILLLSITFLPTHTNTRTTDEKMFVDQSFKRQEKKKRMSTTQKFFAVQDKRSCDCLFSGYRMHTIKYSKQSTFEIEELNLCSHTGKTRFELKK